MERSRARGGEQREPRKRVGVAELVNPAVVPVRCTRGASRESAPTLERTFKRTRRRSRRELAASSAPIAQARPAVLWQVVPGSPRVTPWTKNVKHEGGRPCAAHLQDERAPIAASIVHRPAPK